MKKVLLIYAGNILIQTNIIKIFKNQFDYTAFEYILIYHIYVLLSVKLLFFYF